jgi:uncharacterized protein (TIGR00251 family)
VLKRDGDDALLVIHAQPGAKKTEYAGIYGDALKIRVAAPPLEGRANTELQRFLAHTFGVKLQSVVLLSGDNARHKRFRVLSPTQWPENWQ